MHSQICYRTSVLCQSGQRPNVASVSKSLPGRSSRSPPDQSIQARLPAPFTLLYQATPQIFWRSLSNLGLDERFWRSCTAERCRTRSSEIPRSDVYLHDQSVRVWDQLARSNAERRRMAISKDTTAEQGGKKVVHKLERWIRLSANDRPKPARC